MTDSLVSTWYGTTVSQNKVTEINLSTNNLTGVIPVEIGDFDSLTVLFLEYNDISGEMPVELGNLTDMLWLNFSSNQLTGPILPEFGNMKKLEMLRIDGNNLYGSIPEELGDLIQLEMLIIGWNDLTGTIPNTLGNLTKAKYFWINHTDVEGTIPETLKNLSNVQFLYLENNQLTGTIPLWLGSMTSLEQLNIGYNQLDGIIPDTLRNLMNLQYLTLGGNNLIGEIPGSLGNLTNLYALHLQDMQLTGALPAEITNITEIHVIGIENNDLEDLPDLSSLTNMTWLTIHNNRFTFEDIEPNINVPSQGFFYSPQDSVGISLDTTITEGEDLMMFVDVGGSANLYQWKKDDVNISGAESSTYEISIAQVDQSGSYSCEITSSIVDDLTLYSRPINVTVQPSTDIAENLSGIPDEFALFQNYPNPFNPATSIKFALPQPTRVKIEIFNILGRHISTLLDANKAVGFHTIEFDTSDLSSGLYFYTISVDNFHQIKKMLFVK